MIAALNPVTVAEQTGSTASALIAGELKTLAKHSSHYLAGLTGGLLVGLVSFPVFTRVLPVAEYGLMDLAQRVALILTICSKAGLQNAVLRFYDKERFEADPAQARRYYSTMFLGVAGTGVLLAGLFLGTAGISGAEWFSAPLARLAWFIAWLVVLRSLGSVLWAFLRIEERTKAFNLTTVLTKVATVGTVCALLPWAGCTARTYFIGVVAVESLLVAGLSVWLLRRGTLAAGSFDLALYRTGIIYGLPLVVYEFSFAILGSADRFLVRHYLGPEALGFYSVAYGLAQHANDLLVTPLGLAILPICMRLWHQHGAGKTAGFLTIGLDLFLACAAGLLATSASVARPVVVLLASSKYEGVYSLVPVLLGGLLIYATYIFLSAGLLILEKTALMAIILVVAALVNIGLNCLLLPYMGLTGSAVATLLSYALCIFLLGRASNRYLRLELKPAVIARYGLAAVAAWLAGSLVSPENLFAALAGKACLVLSVYAGLLYLLDPRVRVGCRWVFARAGAVQ